MPYYIMEYLAGGSLRHHMDERFRDDERYVFERRWTINRIILATCNALAQAYISNILCTYLIFYSGQVRC